ncbi:MAG: L,D-transpeptidase [Pseudomonadota bacterium]
MIKLLVNISEQKLYVKNQNKTLKTYFISTGKAGVGQESGSYKTPLGCHEICEKIGAECLINTIFVGRKPTGDIYSEEFALKNNNNDFILTRILWLSGLEPGKNLGGSVDTKSRYIYIHGCPDRSPMGIPLSHGCIRMRNIDIIELFERVDVGTLVDIK